jgi:dUTP pyrophosphatase
MTTPPELPTAPLAYYAEAIDRSGGPAFAGYRIIPALATNGIVTYRPAACWSGGQHHPGLVERLNRDALYAADVIVADLSNPAQVSIGVPSEIEAATGRGIPAVVLWATGRARSVVLQANPLVTFVETWEDAVSIATQHAEKHRAARGHDTGPPTLKLTMALGHEAPQPSHPDDAGFDMVTAVDTVLPPRAFVDVPSVITGVQLPAGTWALITGRSSTIRKRGLLVPSGIIDCGWRGPLMAGAYNMTDQPVTVMAGERIAQVILVPNATEQTRIVKVEQLDPHDRGLNGFGSTGGFHAVDPDDTAGVMGTAVMCAPGDPELYKPFQMRTRAELDALPWASEGEKAQALG